MKHELIMLREVKRVSRLAQTLTKEAKYRAVKSHTSHNVKNGTMGQIEEISRLVRLRDDCLLFCYAVTEALRRIDGESRRLLTQYYINRVNLGAIADSMDVDVDKIYSKLFVARRRFKHELIWLGYDEQWLVDNYSRFNFLAERLNTRSRNQAVTLSPFPARPPLKAAPI